MARQRGKIVRWKLIFKSLSISNRIIEHGSYRWLSLLTTTPKTPASTTGLLSSTADIIFGFLTKKTLISTQNREPRKNYPPSSESWWPCASRTSTMPKNFKSEPRIKVLSHKATVQATKSGWVANISKPSEIASLKPSFLVLFEYYTR